MDAMVPHLRVVDGDGGERKFDAVDPGGRIGEPPNRSAVSGPSPTEQPVACGAPIAVSHSHVTLHFHQTPPQFIDQTATMETETGKRQVRAP